MKYFTITKIHQFDPITQFRLINAFVVGVGLALLAPVLVVLKGALLPIWVIAMFGIIATLAVKTNDFFCQFRLSELYKLGVIVHFILIIAALLYFINPMLMIILESLVGILEVAIFSAYAVVLNNYITDFYPKSMKQFQITRNNQWANAGLIGLSVVTITTYFFSTGIAIGIFVIYNTIFSIYMLKNWNFYDNPAFKGHKEIKC